MGKKMIKILRKFQIGEKIREEGPELHKKKAGTPTMGGLLILASVLIPTLLFADLTNRFIQIILMSTVWMGIMGFLDDYLKNIKKLKKGLIGRYKLIGQIGLGFLIGVILYFFPSNEEYNTSTTVPFIKNLFINFHILYILLVIIVITATSNAVNLTDGLDGLAIGLVAIASMGFGVISYITGHVKFADYLNILYIKGAGELTVYCSALVGASLGFLYFNCHPAQIFMGDTGSLPLGGALGVLAILLKREFLLLILGGVFVIETLSVILQVYYFKRSGGKRIFKMAPIHHHFELEGWSEEKIVVRFWIFGILCLLLSLSTIKLQ
jgi:phospho-N-acetylmuramoyl-pentapeptide-transferase